jgi:hypothetical protein
MVSPTPIATPQTVHSIHISLATINIVRTIILVVLKTMGKAEEGRLKNWNWRFSNSKKEEPSKGMSQIIADITL